MRLLLLFFEFAGACNLCFTQVEEETNKTMYQRGSGSDFNSNQLFRETVSGQDNRTYYTMVYWWCQDGCLQQMTTAPRHVVSLYSSPTPNVCGHSLKRSDVFPIERLGQMVVPAAHVLGWSAAIRCAVISYQLQYIERRMHALGIALLSYQRNKNP